MALEQTLQAVIGAVKTEQSTVCSSKPLSDHSVVLTGRRLTASSDTHWVYSFHWDASLPVVEEAPVTVWVKGSSNAFEGRIVGYDDERLSVVVRKNLGAIARPVTIQIHLTKIFQQVTTRLQNIAKDIESYHHRPICQFLNHMTDPLELERRSGVRPIEVSEENSCTAQSTELVLDALRQNRRVLLTSPRNRSLDELLISIVRSMSAEGLSPRSLVTRYPSLVLEGKGATDLRELAFEQQFRLIVQRMQAELAMLLNAYHRYQKLSPLVDAAREKTHDLHELQALEERLLREQDKLELTTSDLKIRLDTYTDLPILQRLALQVGGKNPKTMAGMRSWGLDALRTIDRELSDVRARVAQLKQEAYLAPELWTEYEHIQEVFADRGGVEQVNALVANEMPTEARFLQGRRLVAATPGCIAATDLFSSLCYDLVIVDRAAEVPLPFLIPTACLTDGDLVLVGLKRGPVIQKFGQSPSFMRMSLIDGLHPVNQMAQAVSV